MTPSWVNGNRKNVTSFTWVVLSGVKLQLSMPQERKKQLEIPTMELEEKGASPFRKKRTVIYTIEMAEMYVIEWRNQERK